MADILEQIVIPILMIGAGIWVAIELADRIMVSVLKRFKKTSPSEKQNEENTP